MKFIFPLVVLLTVGLNLGVLWVGGSAITSGIKSLSNDCGSRYPVEFVFGGNWFCAEKQND